MNAVEIRATETNSTCCAHLYNEFQSGKHVN